MSKDTCKAKAALDLGPEETVGIGKVERKRDIWIQWKRACSTTIHGRPIRHVS